jgi:hypothetical protein
MPNRAARRRAASEHKPIRSKDRRQIVLMSLALLGGVAVAAVLFVLAAGLA